MGREGKMDIFDFALNTPIHKLMTSNYYFVPICEATVKIPESNFGNSDAEVPLPELVNQEFMRRSSARNSDTVIDIDNIPF